MSKVTYKIQNWRQYNRALINRGNITIWFSQDALENWPARPQRRRGRPFLYSETCILLCLTLRARFNLNLRATQGFIEGLFELLGLALPVPSYTQLCRRSSSIKIPWQAKNTHTPIDIVVDSTGLKVYGEGEWKVRIHGKAKRRTWRKLHLAVNPHSFEIVSVKLTESNKTDGNTFPDLIKNIPQIKTAYGDAAYMFKECFEAISAKGGKGIIDLRGGTSLARAPTPGLKQRNRIVREIWDCWGCKKTWKKRSGYHKRSLVETQMFRFKKLLGPFLSSKKMATQVVEAKIKSMILNHMTQLGMPQTIPVLAG